MNYFLGFIAALVAFFSVPSCVTTGDLAEFTEIQQTAIDGIQVAQEEHQRKVEILLGDVTKTDSEILEGLQQISKEREAAVKAIAEQTGMSVKELIQVIEDRTKAVAGAAGTLTGNALVDLLLSTLLGAVGGAAGVNRIRDQRRLVRGEPIGTSTPSHT